MQPIAEPRRYNIITANKLANTLYFHLILNLKSIAREFTEAWKRTLLVYYP